MSIYGVTEDEEQEVAPAKRRRIISEQKLRTRKLSPPKPKDSAVDMATNVVHISEEDVAEFAVTLESLTKEYIEVLKKEIIPHMAALDAAIDYMQAMLSDGVGRSDISSDTSIMTVQKWVLLGHFINKINANYGFAKNKHIDEKLATLMFNELTKTNPLTGMTSSSNSTVGIVTSLKQHLQKEIERARKGKA